MWTVDGQAARWPRLVRSLNTSRRMKQIKRSGGAFRGIGIWQLFGCSINIKPKETSMPVKEANRLKINKSIREMVKKKH